MGAVEVSRIARAKRVFGEAIERQGAERGGFVERECGADAELLGEVRALLEAFEQGGRFMGSPTATGAAAGGPDGGAPIGERPGLRIGPYKLLQRIGEGGFGVVFMAEQETPVVRRVALKIIKLGMDTRAVIARFEAERQALAMMDHPNIARVLDAGATETGRPYFVMELVKGEPVTEYCDRETLSTAQRLDLFTQVCHAVQHAHQKGIIHRDIKPSNVLVSTQDGRAHVRVIDFGIAKATASRLTEKTLFTEHRALIGTPEYMSPEQAEGSLDIDTRTDVYSLGVLLYELLTGSTPFSSRELRSAAYAEIQRIIREVEPPKPSTRLSQSGETLASIAAKRHTEPRRLGAAVRGDLDWIVMRALEKDRQRRYETASSLAADVARHLAGEAVAAAPPGRGYRVRKFVRRNRGAVGAVLAVVMALVLGVGAFAWEAQAARIQRDIAEAARERAELIAAYMSDTLGSTGPSVARGRDITMLKEIMDGAAARIEQGELARAPEAELRLRSTIGSTYRELGVYDAAQRMLEPAAALARSTYPGDHPATVRAVYDLGVLLQEQGRLAEAALVLREALDMSRRVWPGDRPEVADALNALAAVLFIRGDLAAAEPMLRGSLEMKARLFPGDHPSVAGTLDNLASLLVAKGELARAEACYRRSLDMTRRLFPGDHPDVVHRLTNLSGVHVARADLGGAEVLLREALEMTRRLHTGDHHDVAIVLDNLGSVLVEQHEPDQAEPYVREALAMWRRLFPGDHPSVAASLANLGKLLRARGELSEAEARERESLEMTRRLFPGDHQDVARGLWLLANVREAMGDREGARALLQESLDMSGRLFPGDHPEVALAMCRMGRLLQSGRDLAGAEAHMRQSLDMLIRLHPSGHPDVAEGLDGLGELLIQRGDREGGLALLREALQMRRRLFPDGHVATIWSLRGLALHLERTGQKAEAETLLRELVEMQRRVIPRGDANVTQSIIDLATMLEERADLEGAEPLYREAALIFERTVGKDHAFTGNARMCLGRVLTGLGRYAEAEPEIIEAERVMSSIQGAPARWHTRVVEALVALYNARDKAEPGKGYDRRAAEWRARLDPDRAPGDPPR